MGLGDIKEAVQGLPLAKKATPGQMILLFLCCVSLIYVGVQLSNAKRDITDGISNLDKKVEWLKNASWSRDDMRDWTAQLDHANRSTVPAMVIPAVAARQGQTPPPSQ